MNIIWKEKKKKPSQFLDKILGDKGLGQSNSVHLYLSTKYFEWKLPRFFWMDLEFLESGQTLEDLKSMCLGLAVVPWCSQGGWSLSAGGCGWAQRASGFWRPWGKYSGSPTLWKVSSRPACVQCVWWACHRTRIRLMWVKLSHWTPEISAGK